MVLNRPGKALLVTGCALLFLAPGCASTCSEKRGEVDEVAREDILPGRTMEEQARRDEVMIRLGEPEVKGEYFRGVIEEMAASRRPRMRECYRESLQRRPELEGTMNVDFEISPEGGIGALSTQSEGVADEALEGCIGEIFRSGYFAAPRSGEAVPVRFPVEFLKLQELEREDLGDGLSLHLGFWEVDEQRVVEGNPMWVLVGGHGGSVHIGRYSGETPESMAALLEAGVPPLLRWMEDLEVEARFPEHRIGENLGELLLFRNPDVPQLQAAHLPGVPTMINVFVVAKGDEFWVFTTRLLYPDLQELFLNAVSDLIATASLGE